MRPTLIGCTLALALAIPLSFSPACTPTGAPKPGASGVLDAIDCLADTAVEAVRAYQCHEQLSPEAALKAAACVGKIGKLIGYASCPVPAAASAAPAAASAAPVSSR